MSTCEMRRRFSLLVFHLAVLVACTRVARADDQAHIAEAPSWVLPVAVPEPKAGSELDTETLLIDEQGLVEADGDTRFVHVAYRVRTAADLREASELSVERAADELLTWHFVRVHRDGETRELLPALGIKIIQPESGLASGLLDGARRELVLVEDLRAGDTIEYAYSVRASNRTLAGRYTDHYRLARFQSVRRMHLHVSWPAERAIAVRAVNVTLQHPTANSLRYLRDDVPGQRVASHEPDQNDRTPRVELSELQSWADLVAWAVPRYPAAATGEVAALAQRLRGKGPLSDGVQAAIRFVQDEVRYLGIEEGTRALVPHPPEQVLARRYGDCKDKSLLLVALLREMGLQAEPALVSTYWNDAVAEALPSTRAFDHAVVHARMGGQELWVDATCSLQRGPASGFTGLPFGRALLLREGERELTPIPVRMPLEPDLVVHERFTLSSGNSAVLNVETSYLGEEADNMRGKLANQERADLQKSYLDFYGKHYGDVKLLEPLSIDDDPTENRLVVREHYKLSRFWLSGERTVYAWQFEA